MSQVISFEDYRAPARHDDVSWEQVQVEEAPTEDGAWTVIDTIDIAVDPSPADPAQHSFTTANASDDAGLWYRVIFLDGVGNESQPTNPVQNGMPDPVISPLATVPYVSLEEFKEIVGIKVTTDDRRLERALEAATEALTRFLDRDFHVPAATGADEERYFTPQSPLTVPIDDLTELLEVATDLSGTGTFNTVLVEDRDFVLYPLNAPAKRRPYERIKVHPYARFALGSFPRSMRVTGVFGWPQIPDGVVQATILLANRLRLRKDSPFGIASFGTEVAVRLLRTDPDLELMLRDLDRDTVLY